MKKRRRHFYHCTGQARGMAWTAAKITPPFKGESEPDTPRLCVSRTIAGCFAARLFSESDVYVYKTAKKRSGVKPVGVPDALLTGERWIIPPAALVLDSVIPGPVVAEIQKKARAHVIKHREGLGPHKKMILYAESLLILKAAGVRVPAWEENFVTKVLEYFENK